MKGRRSETRRAGSFIVLLGFTVLCCCSDQFELAGGGGDGGQPWVLNKPKPTLWDTSGISWTTFLRSPSPLVIRSSKEIVCQSCDSIYGQPRRTYKVEIILYNDSLMRYGVRVPGVDREAKKIVEGWFHCRVQKQVFHSKGGMLAVGVTSISYDITYQGRHNPISSQMPRTSAIYSPGINMLVECCLGKIDDPNYCQY
jgi:hypothetical protein